MMRSLLLTDVLREFTISVIYITDESSPFNNKKL